MQQPWYVPREGDESRKDGSPDGYREKRRRHSGTPPDQGTHNHFQIKPLFRHTLSPMKHFRRTQGQEESDCRKTARQSYQHDQRGGEGNDLGL